MQMTNKEYYIFKAKQDFTNCLDALKKAQIYIDNDSELTELFDNVRNFNDNELIVKEAEIRLQKLISFCTKKIEIGGSLKDFRNTELRKIYLEIEDFKYIAKKNNIKINTEILEDIRNVARNSSKNKCIRLLKLMKEEAKMLID